jgi:hypothetical protein
MKVKRMSIKRFVQSRNPPFDLVEATQTESLPPDSGALWGDRLYAGAHATDGTDISTRTRHRAYMRAHNLTTADDFTQAWAKAKAARESYMQQGGSVRRADIERALHKG